MRDSNRWRTTGGHEGLHIPLKKLIYSPRRFFWSHINFKEDSVVVADAWVDVACLDEVGGGWKYKS